MGAIALPWMRQPNVLPSSFDAHPFLHAMACEALFVPTLGIVSRFGNPSMAVNSPANLSAAGFPLGQAGFGIGHSFMGGSGQPDRSTVAAGAGYMQFANRTAASANGNTFVGIFIKTGTVAPGSSYLFGFETSVVTGFAASMLFNTGTTYSQFYGSNQQGTGVALTNGVPYMVVASTEAKGANSAWYLKMKRLDTGVMVSNQSGSASITAGGAGTWSCCGSASTNAFSGFTFLAAMGSRYFPPALADLWLAAPWCIFEPEEIGFVGAAAAGGSTFNHSIAESATLADALTATLTLPGNASEALTLADSLSATGIWLASQADSITAADVVSTALTLAATQSEAASLSDTVSATGVWLASRTEAAALSDTVSNTAVLVASMSEAAALSEAMALGQLGNITESLTLADSLTASLVLAAGVSEGATLADAIAVVATLTAAGAESLALADAVSATGGGGAALAPDPRWIITFPRGGFDIEFPPHDWTIRS